MDLASQHGITMPGGFWDLHCDLLMYCAFAPNRSALDALCPCNLQQLQAGRIAHQICAIFTADEPQSCQFAQRQMDHFERARHLAGTLHINLHWAIENAGGLFGAIWEQGSEQAWHWLDQWIERVGPCAYLSPTWNGRGRFGGGAGDEEGLTASGRVLLEGLIQRRIPLDFSHMSDALARDCLHWLDQHAPHHPVLASHSNVRSICPHRRNLPLWLLQALAERGGVVGLCWYPPFVGAAADELLRHAEALLRLSEALPATGGDLFYSGDAYPAASSGGRVDFYPELSGSGDLLHWFASCEQAFGTALALRICRDNAARWADRAAGLVAREL
jgi:membrane dipeptidase